MAKYKDGNYCQIYNKAIEKLNQNDKKISYPTRWLYVHLNLLEHRFTGEKEDFFFRSIKDLNKDTQIGCRQIVDSIKELKRLNLIHTWQMHWRDAKTGKLSEKHITAFRILEI